MKHSQILQEMDALTASGPMTKEKRARLDYYLAASKVSRKDLKRAKVLSPEMRSWVNYLRTGDIREYRDTTFQAGKQTITFSDGSSGGFLIPEEMESKIFEALAQVDPLMSEENVGLIQESTYSMRPKQISGWDLSTIESVQIDENTLQVAAPTPSVAGRVLGQWIHRLTLSGTFEWEADSIAATLDKLARAMAVAFSRGIGSQLVTGSGSGECQGLLAGAHNSGVTTAAAGAISLADLNDVYFSIDRIYRSSPLCAWVISDDVYKQIRSLKTTGGLPLLSIANDAETLFGKKVLISPSMPSDAGSRGVVFGDLSHFVVRLSKITLNRSVQGPGLVENGKANYHGSLRADSSVFDPSAGESPSIVYATLHA